MPERMRALTYMIELEADLDCFFENPLGFGA
jgi:hypothetical protein